MILLWLDVLELWAIPSQVMIRNIFFFFLHCGSESVLSKLRHYCQLLCDIKVSIRVVNTYLLHSLSHIPLLAK